MVDVPSFSLGAGHQLAIFGGSGSGKSTFLNLMAGILKTDSGNITIGNIDISILSEADRDQVRAKLIGCVFQSFHLLQGCTALENLLVAMSVAETQTIPRQKIFYLWWACRKKKISCHHSCRLGSNKE